MSVQSTPESAKCAHCNGERDPQASVAGSFCSTECYYRHKGAAVLRTIRADHTVCPTCFSQIKDVTRPAESDLADIGVPQTIREVFVGFQYATDNTSFGEATIEPRPSDTPYTHPQAIHTRTWGCTCGTPNGSDGDDTLERVEGARTLCNLLGELRRRYDRGELDHRPSKDRLFAALREEGRDWAYAVGRALYG